MDKQCKTECCPPKTLVVRVKPIVKVTLTPELVKSVIVGKSCGVTGCLCNQCSHEGPRCRNGVCKADQDIATCEPFDLVFCLSQCAHNVTDAEAAFLLRPVGCSTSPTLEVEANVTVRTMRARVDEDQLSVGWWNVQPKLVIDGKTYYGPIKAIRVTEALDCPQNEGPYCAETS